MRLSYELDSAGPKDGTRRVLLVMHKGGRARAWSGLHVSPANWDSKRQRVRFGARDHALINDRLSKFMERARLMALERPELTPSDLRSLLKGPDPTGQTFVDQCRNWNASQAKRIAAHTVRVRETALKDFDRACPGCRVLTREALRTFEDHLLGMDLVPNTRRARMKMLRTMYRGVCDVTGVEPKPIFKGMIRAEEETKARGLTPEEVSKLSSVKLSTYDQQVARDAFLFSMYVGGIRFGDMCRLKPGNIVEGALEYCMNKSRRPVWIPLRPEALAIVEAYRGDKYLLPLLNGRDQSDYGISQANAAANNRLKKVAQYAKINPDVSMHWARHTFAHWAAREKVPIDLLRQILGHSSLSITQRYMMRVDREGIRKVFGT